MSEMDGPEARRRFSDVLRLRNGRLLTVRFVEPDDGPALQSYFRSLSASARYNRLMGAASELVPSELDATLHVGVRDRFAVVVETGIDGCDTIVGEARYAFDRATGICELGLSVGDRWQRQGIGTAMLANLACRAAAFGAERLAGETLRSNAPMMGLARNAGFAFLPVPHDWRQVRFEKLIGAVGDRPCASWRIAAAAAHAAAPPFAAR